MILYVKKYDYIVFCFPVTVIFWNQGGQPQELEWVIFAFISYTQQEFNLIKKIWIAYLKQ